MDNLADAYRYGCMIHLSIDRSVQWSLNFSFSFTQNNEKNSQGSKVMVDNLSMKDCQEGIDAFLKKRQPKWTHSNEWIKKCEKVIDNGNNSEINE